eukprot:1160052-Pelagomonas_calceolata.AAC.5
MEVVAESGEGGAHGSWKGARLVLSKLCESKQGERDYWALGICGAKVQSQFPCIMVCALSLMYHMNYSSGETHASLLLRENLSFMQTAVSACVVFSLSAPLQCTNFVHNMRSWAGGQALQRVCTAEAGTSANLNLPIEPQQLWCTSAAREWTLPTPLLGRAVPGAVCAGTDALLPKVSGTTNPGAGTDALLFKISGTYIQGFGRLPVSSRWVALPAPSWDELPQGRSVMGQKCFSSLAVSQALTLAKCIHSWHEGPLVRPLLPGKFP